YSMDLLFSLPHQSIAGVQQDLDQTLEFSPPHVSAYCLTVPETHFMNQSRAPDAEQVKMFDLIESYLGKGGIQRYEISNYAKPGFESRHNLMYWNDMPYWGIGVSAHSYFPQLGSGQGLRFWNSTSSSKYESQVRQQSPAASFLSQLPAEQTESLQ